MPPIIQFRVADGAYVQTLSRYSLPGAMRSEALTPAACLDYSANRPNCPRRLVGLGEAPLDVSAPSLTARQKAGEEPAASEGSLSDGKWVVEIPAITKTYAERRAEIVAAAQEQYRRRQAEGVTVTIGGETFVLRTDHAAVVEVSEGQEELASSSPEEDFPVVTHGGHPLIFSNGVAAQMRAKIRKYTRDLNKREYQIVTAALAAEQSEDHDDFDAINPRSGWPSTTL